MKNVLTALTFIGLVGLLGFGLGGWLIGIVAVGGASLFVAGWTISALVLSFMEKEAAGYREAWLECSGDPASCPENEGHGCCERFGSPQRRHGYNRPEDWAAPGVIYYGGYARPPVRNPPPVDYVDPAEKSGIRISMMDDANRRPDSNPTAPGNRPPPPKSQRFVTIEKTASVGSTEWTQNQQQEAEEQQAKCDAAESAFYGSPAGVVTFGKDGKPRLFWAAGDYEAGTQLDVFLTPPLSVSRGTQTPRVLPAEECRSGCKQYDGFFECAPYCCRLALAKVGADALTGRTVPDGFALVEKSIVPADALAAGVKALELCQKNGWLATDQFQHAAMIVFDSMLLKADVSRETSDTETEDGADDGLVPADPLDMQDALTQIAQLLKCDCTLEEMLYAIDALLQHKLANTTTMTLRVDATGLQQELEKVQAILAGSLGAVGQTFNEFIAAASVDSAKLATVSIIEGMTYAADVGMVREYARQFPGEFQWPIGRIDQACPPPPFNPWKDRYIDRQQVVSKWNAQAVALGFDGVDAMIADIRAGRLVWDGTQAKTVSLKLDPDGWHYAIEVATMTGNGAVTFTRNPMSDWPEWARERFGVPRETPDPTFELSSGQIQQLRDFAGDESTDAPEDQSRYTIKNFATAHSGPGLYAWATEYPEEGMILLDGKTSDSRNRPELSDVPRETELESALGELDKAERRELAKLRKLVNNPQTDQFLGAVRAEVAHQVQRWGEVHDRAKEPQDWYWLVGYLAGKAQRAHIDGDKAKALHHTISTAAVLGNWFAHIQMAGGTFTPGDSDLQKFLDDCFGPALLESIQTGGYVENAERLIISDAPADVPRETGQRVPMKDLKPVPSHGGYPGEVPP